MPHPEMERLEKDSSKEQVQAAISACIAAEIRNGREQKQAQAMCFSMAKERTGGLPEGGK